MTRDRAPRPPTLGERLIEAGWLAALVVSPLFFDLHTARTFEPDKAALVRTLATWMAACWAAAAIERGGLRFRGAAFGPLTRPVALFALALLLSTALSLSPWTSWWGSYERLQGAYTTLAYLVLFAAVATHLRTRDQLERIACAIVVASVPVCVYGILQRAGRDPIDWSDVVTGRVYSTLGAATFLGAYVAMLVPLTVALAWRRGQWRLGYGLAAGLQVATLVLTKSRGPLLGLAAATFLILLFALLAWRRTEGRREWAWRAWLGGAAFVLALGVLLNVRGTPLDPLLDPIRNTSYGQRLSTITESRRGTGKIRLLVWEAAIARMHDLTPVGAGTPESDGLAALRPLVGFGPESTRLAFASVHPAELAYFEDRGKSADRAHNAGVEQLVTGGALGLAAYWLLMIAVLHAALRALGLAGGIRTFTVSLSVGTLVGGLIALVLGRALTYVALGAPCGLLVALVVHVLRTQRTEPPAEPRIDPGVAPPPALVHGLLGLVLVDFVQTQFGFDVTATSVLFWVAAGLLVAVTRGLETHVERDPVAVRVQPALLVLLVTAALVVQGVAHVRTPPTNLADALAAAPPAAGRVRLWHAAPVLWTLAFAWLAAGRPRFAAPRGSTLLLVAAAAGVSWFGNVQPIRADVFQQIGNRCAAAGDLQSAIAMHGRARAHDPRETRFTLALAQDHHLLAKRTGDPEVWRRGETFAREAREREPFDADHAANLARYYLAWALAGNSQKLGVAQACFEDALALAPEDVLVHKELAQVHRAAGDYVGAIARLEASAEIDARYPPTWVLLGDTHAVRGDADAALAAHGRAMATRVRGIDGFATFADEDVDLRLAFYIGAGRMEAVLSTLEELRAERPKDARVPWTIARVFVVAKRMDEALVHALRAAELDRTALAAARALAARYPVAAFLRDAEELSRRVRATEIEIRRALALELEGAGDDPAAIAQLELALVLDPDDARTLGHLAVAYRRTGNLDRALTLGHRARAAAPPSQAASWTRFLDETRAARGR